MSAFSFSMRRHARRLLHQSAAKLGYVVDGNHVFTAADYAAIAEGKFRHSVSERPAKHSDRVKRVAFLVQQTF